MCVGCFVCTCMQAHTHTHTHTFLHACVILEDTLAELVLERTVFPTNDSNIDPATLGPGEDYVLPFLVSHVSTHPSTSMQTHTHKHANAHAQADKKNTHTHTHPYRQTPHHRHTQPQIDVQVSVDEASGIVGVYGRTDTLPAPVIFTSVALRIRFPSIADHRGLTTWTLTNTSALGVEARYEATPLPDTSIAPTADDIRGFFTLLDLDPPVFTHCPSDVTVSPQPHSAVAFAQWSPAVATDNRGVASLTASAANGTFPLVAPTAAHARVVYVARDFFSNEATCAFRVIVEDTEAPVVSAPRTVTRVLQPNSATVTVSTSSLYPAVVSDNAQLLGEAWADPVLLASNATGTYGYGVHTVSLTFADAFGNEVDTHTVLVVQDVTPPVAVCPSDIERVSSTGAGVAVSWTLFDPTDNSNLPVDVTANRTSGSTFTVGSHAVGVTAVDRAGNTATCVFTVTVASQGNNNSTTPPAQSSGASTSPIIIGASVAGGVVVLTVAAALFALRRARAKARAPQNWDDIFELMNNMQLSEEGFRCVWVLFDLFGLISLSE